MLDPLPIIPFNAPASGSVRLPGSKSITNRALLLASLADGETLLKGALFSEDTRIMVQSLRRLGFELTTDENRETIRVRGEGGRVPRKEASLFVGNAGTAARFLTALCCLAPAGAYELDGVPEMRKRPMKGLLDALQALGAEIESRDGCFPIRIRSNGLAGGPVQVDAAASSQMLSALLMVAPLARRDSLFSFQEVRLPFVEMTLRMMGQFGQGRLPGLPSGEISVAGGTTYHPPKGGSYEIEADVTAASYFATLPLVTGGHLTIENLHGTGEGLQGDSAYFDILKKLGCQVARAEGGGSRFGFTHPLPPAPLDVNFSGFSDTFLTFAAVSPLLTAPVRIRGIGHTREQETDRVAGMARELQRLGQEVVEHEDALEIFPSLEALKKPELHEIATYRDHRFAMSFALLGALDLHQNGRPWLAIRDPGCCAKTFPEFFRVLEAIHQRSHPSSRG